MSITNTGAWRHNICSQPKLCAEFHTHWQAQRIRRQHMMHFLSIVFMIHTHHLCFHLSCIQRGPNEQIPLHSASRTFHCRPHSQHEALAPKLRQMIVPRRRYLRCAGAGRLRRRVVSSSPSEQHTRAHNENGERASACAHSQSQTINGRALETRPLWRHANARTQWIYAAAIEGTHTYPHRKAQRQQHTTQQQQQQQRNGRGIKTPSGAEWLLIAFGAWLARCGRDVVSVCVVYTRSCACVRAPCMCRATRGCRRFWAQWFRRVLAHYASIVHFCPWNSEPACTCAKSTVCPCRRVRSCVCVCVYGVYTRRLYTKK